MSDESNQAVTVLLEIDPSDPLHCPRCGGLHLSRTLYRCTMCHQPFCVMETEPIVGNPRGHFTRGLGGNLNFCGYAMPTSEVLA